MKIVKILLAAVFAVTSLSASAQEKDEYEFVKHPYIQLQGGAQYTLGEDTKFKNLISPNAQIAIGYQFSPVFGARLAANGIQSKGGALDATLNHESKDFKWNYVAPGLDATFNLSNLLCGWNPKRVLNVSAFLGAGLNIAWANDDAIALASHTSTPLNHLWDGTKLLPVGRGGLAVDFRLSDAISLGIEGNANVLNDQYNSKHTDNPDWYFNALVGLKVNLGKTYNKKEKPVVVEPEPEPVVVPAPEPVKQPEPVKVVAPVEKKIDVFFLIRSSKISDEENVKVQDMINFLKANPETKVVVTGYADAGTGNPRINMGYSQNRADVVEKALLDAGIDASRITKEAKGDTVQPFAENDLNRVTIAIAK